MKKILILFFTFTLILTGCSKADSPKSLISQLLAYENTYLGDNTSVSHIVELLPGHTFVTNGISLQTKNEPYGMTIEYIKTEENTSDFTKLWTEENTKKILLNNATVLFGLVQNVGIIQFKLPDMVYTFTRSDVEHFFGEKASELMKRAKPGKDANYYFEKNYETFYK